MKSFHALCMIILCIASDHSAHDSPKAMGTLQLETLPEPRTYNTDDCAAKSCVACCWTTAFIPTVIACLINDLSCGAFCGTSPCKSNTVFHEDTIACPDSCPPYCIPNTRHGLKAILDCKPTIMR